MNQTEPAKLFKSNTCEDLGGRVSRMLVAGLIETTSFHVSFCLQITYGLDTADNHCLLDHRVILNKNPRSAIHAAKTLAGRPG